MIRPWLKVDQDVTGRMWRIVQFSRRKQLPKLSKDWVRVKVVDRLSVRIN